MGTFLAFAWVRSLADRYLRHRLAANYLQATPQLCTKATSSLSSAARTSTEPTYPT